jgi:hypothetical protein
MREQINLSWMNLARMTLPWMPLLWMLLPGGSLLIAQPTVAPTGEPVGPIRGTEAGGYNLTNSWEAGYRFHGVGGNQFKYGADVNYGNGVRLLSGNFTAHSREGQGKYFDEMVLNVQGLGSDPYEFSNLRVRKNGLYRYDMLWRMNDYFNPGLYAPFGSHPMNTERKWQDHELTIFPQSKFRLIGGFGQNTQEGPALSTIRLFDGHGDQYFLFSDINRRQREYRLGGQVVFRSFRATVFRGWQQYAESTSNRSDVPQQGYNQDDLQTLTSFRRIEPYAGDTPFWNGSLSAEAGRWLAITGQGSYAGGRRDFTLEESSIGTDRFGAGRNRQVLVHGSARRPLTTGALTVGVFPTQKFTVTNHTAFHQTRMDGDSTMQELNNATLGLDLLSFQFLGVKTMVNSTEAHFRPARWIGFFGGYRYSVRDIRSVEGETFEDFTDQMEHKQRNRLNAGLAGVRIQPVQGLSISLDAQIGRADMPFTPVAERDYHAIGGRIEYRTRTLQLSAATGANYNINSVTMSEHSSRWRNYAFDGSWTPSRRFALDAGYGKLHLDTLSGLAYFSGGGLVDERQSIYISNIHTAHLGTRISPFEAVDLYFGYSRVQDVGDGRPAPPQTADAFQFWQVFPLSFESPQGRISIRLHQKIRWNFGYQYYRYDEKFLTRQNYRAHTGYSSILWSF